LEPPIGKSKSKPKKKETFLITLKKRPQELDDAARRRFVKRLYVPLPEKEGRKQIVVNLMSKQAFDIDEDKLEKIAELTDGLNFIHNKRIV
jgi:SpoVK/Ycf46/Vps4 family AAA+-type ATPase